MPDTRGYRTFSEISLAPMRWGGERATVCRFALRLLPRWFVGCMLIATGMGKALDIPGFVQVVAAYALLPAWGNVLVAYTLPFVELVSGLYLLTRRWRWPVAWIVVWLHVVLLSVVVVSWWRGLTIANCGCFGVFLARPLSGQTIIEDVVMLGASLLVLRNAHGGELYKASLNPSDMSP